MAIKAAEIGDEAIGGVANQRYVDAAIAAAEKLIAAEPAQDRWVRPLIRAIRHHRLRIPALSQTTQRVIALVEMPDVNLDDLAEAVSGDPALAMRLIGVANSSYFRGATEVLNVRDALMRMGVREARTIIVVVALRSTVLRSQGLGESAQALWKHSLLSAVAAQEITQELPPWELTGFLAGLLHDIGRLVVLAFVAELPAWQEDGTEPSAADVDEILAATHAELGAMLLASWGFPEAFCEAVLVHHAPSQSEGDIGLLARAIELAQSVAHQLAEGWPDDPAMIDPVICARGEALGISLDRLADLAQESEASCEALNKLN